MKLRFEIELDYDAEVMHGDDPTEIEWFMTLLMTEELILHSNEIGDAVGTVRILHPMQMPE